MKDKVTVLIPIHKIDDNIIALLKKAIESVKDVKNILLVLPKPLGLEIGDILLPFNDELNLDLTVCVHESDTDFCTQVNEGVKYVRTEYFSILEFDDTYSNFFFDDLTKFISSDFSESDIILPIVGLHDGSGKVLAMGNDAAWAQDFSEKRGFLDEDSTSMYDIFMVSGGVFKTKPFIEIGGLKSDIVMYFSKELFLRSMHNGLKISVLPKIGYKHTVGRIDSLFHTLYNGGFTRHESQFYNRQAIEQYKLNPNSEDYVKVTYTAPELDESNA